MLEFLTGQSNFQKQNEIAYSNKVSNAYVTNMKKTIIFVISYLYENKKKSINTHNSFEIFGDLLSKSFIILIKYKCTNFRKYLTLEKIEEIKRLSNLIIKKLDRDCSLYLFEIKQLLENENQITTSTSTIYNYLTKSLNWSNKKILHFNPNRFGNNNFQERIQFVRIITESINKFGVENVLFRDETGFKRNRRDNGSSLVGKRPFKSHVGRINPKYNMFCFINSSGIEEISLIDHTAKGVDHAEFMLRGVLDIIKKNNTSKSVIVMDNHSIHKWCENWITEYFAQYNCHIIYMPVYSPDLNPIEMVFGTLKHLLKDHQDIWGVSPKDSIFQSIFDFNTKDYTLNFIKKIFPIK
ncbi:integrase protein-related [Anaeramoeba flamelloides]|uniref:Integrase protein-related n=1 Tax=Anaeramoeba flamelloides TaxID=1746091 RepID=A0AAV7YH31_9EUKA|nr:integrase protein-related [Anaeramoeba flamelloides]